MTFILPNVNIIKILAEFFDDLKHQSVKTAGRRKIKETFSKYIVDNSNIQLKKPVRRLVFGFLLMSAEAEIVSLSVGVAYQWQTVQCQLPSGFVQVVSHRPVTSRQ